jgi:hypothetical protein
VLSAASKRLSRPRVGVIFLRTADPHTLLACAVAYALGSRKVARSFGHYVSSIRLLLSHAKKKKGKKRANFIAGLAQVPRYAAALRVLYC